jgi:outer membrane cobalamin receptor
MKSFKFFSIFFLFILSFRLTAQDKFTLGGNIKDSLTNENISSATIIIKEINQGITTDRDGNFSISLPKGKYTLSISFLGYKTIEQRINLNSDVNLVIQLPAEASIVDEVIVKDKRETQNVDDTKMSTGKMDIKQIRKLPALFGEVDVIKNMQMLPGIQVAGEGNTGLYVRGGSPDQNLVLLDDAPIYNASHVGGMFSIFNADALKSAEIYKGGIPAQYGGRLSSLVDIKTKEGSMTKFSGSGGIGLPIASRLTLEGPILKNKLSFMVSGRRTYIDEFFFISDKLKGNKIHFYDVNVKLTYHINAKNKLFFSGYSGRDVLKFKGLFGLSFGNTTGTLRLNHVFNEKLTSNTILIYSDFVYVNSFDIGIQKAEFTTGIKERSLKQDFSYSLNSNNEISFGVMATYRKYNPGKFVPTSDNSLFKPVEINNYYSLDEGIYISNKQKFNKRLTVDYGLRYSIFSNIGPGNVNQYKSGDISTDSANGTVDYKSGQNIKTFSYPEPRISARFMLTESSSIKATYNRMYQYLHLMSNSTSPIPFNMWVPSTNYIKPQKADQVAAGYFRNFLNNKFETSIEGYYKQMNNALDFKDNAQILLNPHIETELKRGKSWSYGLELYLKKSTGKTTGWISYTWSKTERKIPGVNEGRTYYASYDRRHNFNFVFSHDFNDRLNFSANWIYGSGRPFTLPAAKYQIDYMSVSYYTERNGYRMPAYHRLDAAINLNSKKKEGRTWSTVWNFSIYNLYGRKNPFTIFVQEDPKNPGKNQVVMIYLFQQLPSITFNFNF